MYSSSIMADVNTSEQLEKARKELADLIVKREQIEIEIAKQKRRVAAWSELCEQGEFAEVPLDLDLGGLTEACRTVLRSSRKEWMTTADIQRDLRELGFRLSDYKAPAVLHHRRRSTGSSRLAKLRLAVETIRVPLNTNGLPLNSGFWRTFRRRRRGRNDFDVSNTNGST